VTVKAGYQVEQREGFWLYFEEQDKAVAEVASLALQRTLKHAQDRWGLSTPEDLHMVIMTGWRSYLLATAPLLSKIQLFLFYPLWVGRVKRTWIYAGGWQNRFGRRNVVGVKPPRLIETADRRMGRMVYVEVEDMTEKLRHMVYHEATHACTSHLRLPAWFNEGIAMLSTDELTGIMTVKPETVETLDRGAVVTKTRQVRSHDPETLVPHYVRGYWITRYYEEKHPGLLTELLKKYLGRAELESRLAQAEGITREQFWTEIEGKVKAHFRENPLE
jgi:hypothetical protein